MRFGFVFRFCMMSSQGGRPKNESVWTHFVKTESGGKVYGECKYCGLRSLGNATRMRYHLQKCEKVPELAKVATQSRETGEQSNQKRAPDHGQSIAAASSKKSKSLHPFMDVMSPKVQALVNQKILKAVVTSNLPLSTFETAEWKDVFKELRPAFQLPSRKMLSGPLLDAEYERIKQTVDDEIKK